MGRKKVAMQYIEKPKKRITTFEKRKKGLLKKAYELATLCDVPLCMIIYPDLNSNPNPGPVTYPEKKEDLEPVITRYLAGSKEDNAKRNLNLEQGLALGKKQKKGQEVKVDTEDVTGVGKLDLMSRDELVELGLVLDQKLAQVEERMRGSFGIYNMPAWQGDQGYFPQVGPSNYVVQAQAQAQAQAQPLNGYYNNGGIKFEAGDQLGKAISGFRWYQQGEFFQ